MSKLLKGLGLGAGGLVLLVGGGAAWVEVTSSQRSARTYETHRGDFPVPFPLTEAEVAALRAEREATLAAQAPPTEPALVGSAGGAPATGAATDPATDAAAPTDPLAGLDLDAIALERAVARGEHLVNARYACVECHGKDYSGGTMIDDPAIGRFLGRNLTGGKGSVVAGYTTADWDRIVRHGVKPDGTGAVMPSEDYLAMSDRELSDIVAYIRTQPPVDGDVPPPTYGPLGKVLSATGQWVTSAERVPDHQAAHRVEPPEAGVTVEFGEHLSKVCTGCHNPALTGGPQAGAPPDWAVPRNLTPHAEGLQGWSYEDFVAAMRESRRPDGTPLQLPMTMIAPYAQRMTDTELQALWTYLQQLPPSPTPKG
ncbi:c-type cytochrome [Myxococcota bacterium]|nr:c-type cytochrome [Myxococcota bacterium]